MLDMDKMVVITAAVFCGFMAYGMLQREGKIFCTRSHQGDTGRVPVRDRRKGHYPYRTYVRVEGMNCAKCALKVENSLNRLPDTWATARPGDKRVLVRTKQPFREEPVRRAIEEAGYTVLGWEPIS